ncbi:MAG: hypothetical protein LC098_14305 [Burkholderiales bacterium]|nr:hypothetical protein [Burkholderiales bacterium]
MKGRPMLASTLVATSAGIVLLFGSIHLLFTLHGNKLHPRDPAVMAAMQRTHPVLTRQTTMWRANHGFNVTHSIGLMLFGLVYGYLALLQPMLLWRSEFLQGLGLVTLVAYLVVARLCFFSLPVRGVTLATLLYAAGVALSLRA